MEKSVVINIDDPENITNHIRIFDMEGRLVGRVQRLDLASTQYLQKIPQIDGTVREIVGAYSKVEFVATHTEMAQQG